MPDVGSPERTDPDGRVRGESSTRRRVSEADAPRARIEPSGPAGAVSLGARLRGLRADRRLSLDRLATLSGVSRSAISKIERDEVTPGTTRLSALAEALDTTFAELMSPAARGEVVVLKRADQPVLVDERSGFTRRCIAPILPSRGLDWVHNTLPAGREAASFVPHRHGVEEYIYVLEGVLDARVGGRRVRLEAGDALYFEAQVPHEFAAAGLDDCRYLLIIDSRAR